MKKALEFIKGQIVEVKMGCHSLNTLHWEKAEYLYEEDRRHYVKLLRPGGGTTGKYEIRPFVEPKIVNSENSLNNFGITKAKCCFSCKKYTAPVYEEKIGNCKILVSKIENLKTKKYKNLSSSSVDLWNICSDWEDSSNGS